ncbi:NAD(P)H-hydrate dehydratase [Camelliibacillus cellulosilyticus]|uniref:Bifunctional NAD(P)H-hydrate repair enzyme n=1 Tax=Camelliibacillus cellulosilyticus TaxID=2174486 RepID=A0ABV9GPK8_9BACL
MQIVSREAMQAMDRHAIDCVGIDEKILMENAGRAVFQSLASDLRNERKIGVVIGKGNNGGDGLVIARYIYDRESPLDVWLVPERQEITGIAAVQLSVYEKAGGSVRFINEEGWEAFRQAAGQWTIAIDCLLGTGFQGAPRPLYLDVIQLINRLDIRVISVDLPSGVPANGGNFDHEAVRASLTLTLQCPKIAQFTFPAANFYGATEVLDIGIPKKSIRENTENRRVWNEVDVKKSLPIRARSSHKSSHGRGLILAGEMLMSGAAVLAIRAASRAGAGLVAAGVPEAIRTIVGSQAVEATFDDHDYADASVAKENLPRYDAVAFGQGAGRDVKTEKTLLTLLKTCPRPLVIDADGLFYLKKYAPLLTERQAPTILTPHSGEMARLLGKTAEAVENDRFGLSLHYATSHNVYLVLKGPYTIVTTPDGRQFVNTTGNPGLAKGGTGDVLTGILLAFLMQHRDVASAICNAVYVHGHAADRLFKEGVSSLSILPSDIVNALPGVLFDLQKDTIC